MNENNAPSLNPSMPVTGRSPWDFAAELLLTLQRIGPTAIVVAGFLFFGYFFYVEVNKAKLQADKQLQEKLNAAQNQLVATYEKMGGMSGQLIKNIDNLFKLNSAVDKEIEISRQKLKTIEMAELKALHEEKQNLNMEIQRVQDKIDATYIRLKIAAEDAKYAIRHISTTHFGKATPNKERKQVEDKISGLINNLPAVDADIVRTLRDDLKYAVDLADAMATELKHLDKALMSLGVTKSLLKLQLGPNQFGTPDGKLYKTDEIDGVEDHVILEWLRPKK